MQPVEDLDDPMTEQEYQTHLAVLRAKFEEADNDPVDYSPEEVREMLRRHHEETMAKRR